MEYGQFVETNVIWNNGPAAFRPVQDLCATRNMEKVQHEDDESTQR